MQFTFSSAEPVENLLFLQTIIASLLQRAAEAKGVPLNIPAGTPIPAVGIDQASTAAPAAPATLKPRAVKAAAKLSDPVVTVDQVRSILIEKAKAGKEDQGKALLGEFGCVKLSQIPEERLAEFHRRAQAL